MRHKIVWGLVIPLLYILAGYFAAKAFACDPGQYYDPAHQICAPYPPANQPGWGPWQTNQPPPPGTPGWGR